MKTKSYYFKIKLSLILSILLLIFAANNIPFSSVRNLKTVKLEDIQLSSINFVNPIFINDTDPEYNWSKTAADNDWCSGSGSWSDPYVIQNITINGNNTSSCIEVRNSNVYFKIQNCTLYNSSSGKFGLYLRNANNSVLVENNCSFNFGSGIGISLSNNNTIKNNFATNNTSIGMGLWWRGTNNTVSNNTFANNRRGLFIYRSTEYTAIENNSIYGNSESSVNSAGILIFGCNNVSITNNKIFENNHGIYLSDDSSNNLFKDNLISSNIQFGIYEEGANNNKYINNTIYNSGSKGIRLRSGDICWNNTIYSCPVGIDVQNCINASIMYNTIINCTSNGRGIDIGHDSYNITVSQNNLINSVIAIGSYSNQISTYNITKTNLVNGRPVYFYKNKLGLTPSNFSNPGQIILFKCNNTLLSNLNMSGGGITAIGSINNTISRNRIMSYNNGIFLQDCSNNTLYNNTVSEGEIGIMLYGSAYNNITANKIHHNNYGVSSFLSYSNTLHENEISNNLIGLLLFGFMEYSSKNHTIIGNKIMYNSEVGLRIESNSNNSLICNNSFIGNTLSAQDNGTNNQWDNGVIGNFWDDYSGDDVNLDGIGDIQYNISGSAKSVDHFPQIIKSTPQIIIENPYANEFFSHNPPDIELTIISPNIDIDTIWYSLNNETYTTNNHNFTGELGQNIWDSLGNGTLTIKFYANNSYGLIGRAEVRVRKDIFLPQIIIHSPIENQEFTIDAPSYNITILEPNLDLVWYTIDNGIINITFTELTGSVSQGAWDSAPNGPITIYFYARDIAGNLAENHIVIIKTAPEGQEPIIPGYNVYLLIGTISVVIVILMRKRYRI